MGFVVWVLAYGYGLANVYVRAAGSIHADVAARGAGQENQQQDTRSVWGGAGGAASSLLSRRGRPGESKQHVGLTLLLS